MNKFNKKSKMSTTKKAGRKPTKQVKEVENVIEEVVEEINRNSPEKVSVNFVEKKTREPKEQKETVVKLKEMVDKFNSLLVLNSSIASLSKGEYLTYPNTEGTEPMKLTRANLKALNNEFAKEIMGLKSMMKSGKNKQKLSPASFSGTYSPIVAGPALVKFFTMAPERFGYIDPAAQSGPTLMSALPLASAGYMQRNT